MRAVAGLVVTALLWAQPALAQQAGPSVLRDAETEALFDDMARPLAIGAGLAPGNLKVVLLNDKEINAFVAGGQTVYVNSGLIEAADNLNEGRASSRTRSGTSLAGISSATARVRHRPRRSASFRCWPELPRWRRARHRRAWPR